jgi:hypothetical protein
MGIDLSNKYGDWFRASFGAWGDLLQMANKHGWEPAGTRTPVHWDVDGPKPAEEWCGTYFSNDGQWVTDDDARNIASALRKALYEEKFERDGDPDWPQYVRHFVTFCQNGEFRIM